MRTLWISKVNKSTRLFRRDRTKEVHFCPRLYSDSIFPPYWIAKLKDGRIISLECSISCSIPSPRLCILLHYYFNIHNCPSLCSLSILARFNKFQSSQKVSLSKRIRHSLMGQQQTNGEENVMSFIIKTCEIAISWNLRPWGRKKPFPPSWQQGGNGFFFPHGL